MLYQNFCISSEEDGYRLSDSNFTEDARGGLYFNITMRFSTRDRDQDGWSRVYRVEYKTVSGDTMTEKAGSCLSVYWGFRGVDYEEVQLYRATIAVSLKSLLGSLLARGSGIGAAQSVPGQHSGGPESFLDPHVT